MSSSWFVGYTPQLSTAVMLVRGNGTEALNGYLDTFYGANYPTETWTAYMKLALTGEPVEQFPEPAELQGETPTFSPPPTTFAPLPPRRSRRFRPRRSGAASTSTTQAPPTTTSTTQAPPTTSRTQAPPTTTSTTQAPPTTTSTTQAPPTTSAPPPTTTTSRTQAPPTTTAPPPTTPLRLRLLRRRRRLLRRRLRLLRRRLRLLCHRLRLLRHRLRLLCHRLRLLYHRLRLLRHPRRLLYHRLRLLRHPRRRDRPARPFRRRRLKRATRHRVPPQARGRSSARLVFV
ncbi:MAG: hypothetical protein WKF73_13570 [Nocardioidaceae bacterium]